MKKRSVSILSGGGGPLLTGTIDESKAYNCHSELRERAEAQSENVKSNCHAELVSASVQRCALPVSLDRCRNHLARLAKNGTARACAKERGLSRRALDSTQGKPCSVALLGLTFTMTARLSRFHNGLVGLRSAFTMAEILLSLTIIGVVAAITLPSLTGNINERTWNTQRKALYARFSQAIALMPSLNGYGTLRESTDSAGSTSIEDTAAETFVTSGLSKVLKINNICDNEHLEDCGLPSRITTLDASQISTPTKMSELNSKMTSVNVADWISSGAYLTYDTIDTKAAAFETANGESILVFYNPSCQADMQETGRYYVQTKLCATFIYDLNGNKGPNTVNKDVGIISVIYPTDSVVVAPYPHAQNASTSVSYDDSAAACTAQDSEYRVPNKYELMSMFSAQKLYGLSASSGYNTSSLAQIQYSTLAWRIAFVAGTMEPHPKTHGYALRCVKR